MSRISSSVVGPVLCCVIIHSDNQKMLIYWTKEKSSIATRASAKWYDPTRRLEPRDRLLQLGEGLGIQRVVNPPAFLPIDNQASVLQHLQMERQARLRRVQLVL